MVADRATKLLRHVSFLSVLLAGAAALCAQSMAPVSPATLYTEFQQQPPPAVTEAIRGETEAIMGRLGIGLAWRSLASATGSEVSVQLAVVRFRGRCDVGGLSPHRVQPGALGWTHESDGVILPFGDVDCDRIRSFLQVDLLGVSAGERDLVFGRAVGRVLAHELYHIFTRSPHHSPEGVGKAAYAVRDLLAGRFVFDASESMELRNGPPRIGVAEPTH
ncbi:MAG TPA: hypothetical protein VIN93_01890 [Bryobacteraceae bacterium]